MGKDWFPIGLQPPAIESGERLVTCVSCLDCGETPEQGVGLNEAWVSLRVFAAKCKEERDEARAEVGRLVAALTVSKDAQHVRILEQERDEAHVREAALENKVIALQQQRKDMAEEVQRALEARNCALTDAADFRSDLTDALDELTALRQERDALLDANERMRQQVAPEPALSKLTPFEVELAVWIAAGDTVRFGQIFLPRRIVVCRAAIRLLEQALALGDGECVKLACGCTTIRRRSGWLAHKAVCPEGRRLEAEMVAIQRDRGLDHPITLRERWVRAQQAFAAHFEEQP